jgi:alanine racemase
MSYAVVDFSALASNLRVLKSRVRGRKIMAAVKANAYGHGLVPTALRLQRLGIDYLAVAFASEGVRLRTSGIRTPILILSALEDADTAVRHGLSVTVYSERMIPLLERAAAARKRRLKVHLDADTGMGRIGLPPDRIIPAAERILGSRHLILEGFYTHFSSSEDRDDPYVEGQLRIFRKILSELSERGIRPPLIHAANSGAILNRPDAWFDMVRPGIALYGYPPGPGLPGAKALKPVLSLHSRIAFLKTIRKKTGIGYSHSYTARPGQVIATVPVGYGDGYDRRLSNAGRIILRDRFAPVVGRVSMDQITVDVTNVPRAAEGDPVILLGSSGRLSNTADDIARQTGTISYEVLCAISPRIERVYEG